MSLFYDFLQNLLPIILLLDLFLEVHGVHRLVELLPDFHANLAHLAVHSVKQVTVVEHQLHIPHELTSVLILVLVEFPLNCREIHRLLDHL